MDDRARDGGAEVSASAVAKLERQRAITERLLLAALNELDASTEAATASRRANFLAAASRELAMSLDDGGALEAIRRRTLPREGSWCIVDVVESDGVLRRLPVAHPDRAKQPLAQMLADRWVPAPHALTAGPNGAPGVDAHATERSAALRDVGFGCLLVVPLIARTTVLGAITFVVESADAPFSAADISLASELADLCALALDNERLYRQARELSESASAANRAKSTILGNVSHELVTPLNAIGGYVTLIEMGLRGPVSEEQLVDLERIRHNQVHVLTLISDILTFVRSETGRLEYRFSEVSAEAMLHEVSDMLRGAADERRLTLVHQAADAKAVMWADPDRVRQILVNLVMNAIKYAAADGGQIVLSASETPSAVSIHVADNGPGIPTEKLDAVFQPFVQLAAGAGERRGGVGLGLTISRDLARAMSGELSVESRAGVVSATPDDTAPRGTEGCGATFTLTLPRHIGRRARRRRVRTERGD